MASATLILPFQLFQHPCHPALAARQAQDRPVVMIEDSLIFGGDRDWPLDFHAQKLLLHRATMKAYAAQLTERGFDVRYCEWRSGIHLDDWLAELKIREVHVCELVDHLLERRLAASGVTVIPYQTPAFCSPHDWLHDQFAKDKKPFMATFYQTQRKRMGILVDDNNKPLGGKWSYDPDNRKKLPKQIAIPERPTGSTDKASLAFVAEARAYVAATFPNALGRLPDEHAPFRYPINHHDADNWLEHFLDHRFRQFGDYEDAISVKHRMIFHSVLTPMLNIGLLTPTQIIERALAIAEERAGGPDEIPLNSLEGFVRQIIGWREFMRAMYERHGVEGRNRNFWQFDERPMPAAFYDATTGIAPVDETIRRVLEDGYCHHIERLMVLGNFMLLCRIHPRSVYRWFMELFVDAYDWVMVPNVYGMSQFADGGLFVTKPYISGSNYIRKMSDWKKGDWCPVWDGLFWTFIEDHRDFFDSNFRLKMMVRNLDKMDQEKRSGHRKTADAFRSALFASS